MTHTITWYGHATFGIEIGEYHLLIDPWFTGNPVTPITADEINPTHILVTHGHGDHIEDAAPIAQRAGAQVISNVEICRWLHGQGVETVHGLNHGGAYTFDFGRAKYTIAHHSSGLPDGSYGGQPGGFILYLPGDTIYIAGDTALFMDMQLYGDEDIDLAILPIGDNYTMGPGDAFKALGFLRPRAVIPCHYNTFPRVSVDVNTWENRIRAQTMVEPIIMKPGDAVTRGA